MKKTKLILLAFSTVWLSNLSAANNSSNNSSAHVGTSASICNENLSEKERAQKNYKELQSLVDLLAKKSGGTNYSEIMRLANLCLDAQQKGLLPQPSGEVASVAPTAAAKSSN